MNKAVNGRYNCIGPLIPECKEVLLYVVENSVMMGLGG